MSYTSAKSRRSFPFDGLLEMKSAGLAAASAAAQLSGAPKILDAGAARFEGVLVIDVTAIEVATGDEAYPIQLQGSNSATFASGVETVAEVQLGDSSVTGNSADSGTGRRELGITNVGADGAPYRYLRVYTKVVGTVATGIGYSAFIAPRV